MAELEQQIHSWVEAEVDGVDPVTAGEVLARHDAPAPPVARRRSQRRRRIQMAAAVAATVLVVAGVIQLESHDDDSGDDTVRLTPAPQTVPDGWRFMTTPGNGWTFVAPTGWSATTWDGYCDGTSGAVVVNSKGAMLRAQDETTPEAQGCVTEWEPMARNRPDIVALEIVDDGTDPGTSAADTEVPLDLDDLELDDRGRGNEPAVRRVDLALDGDGSQHLEVWIGDDASAADRDVLRRMVASVRPPNPRAAEKQASIISATGSPRSTTLLTCMIDRGYDPVQELLPRPSSASEVQAEISWPDGQSRRSGFDDDLAECTERGDAANRRLQTTFSAWPPTTGPSQTAAAAERDGVIPAVAALPVVERAVPTTWFDTTEGTWALTEMPLPDRGEGSYDCTVGDPDGVWGTDWVCSDEYGEVVLVDDDGRIERAYPMPGSVPTWITATDDAVYAGRSGDGGAPDSTIVRIDRETLEAEVLVFPAQDGLLGVAFPNWSMAPDGTDIDDLVQVISPDDPLPDGRTLAASWVGVTSIDLPAVEQLFA